MHYQLGRAFRYAQRTWGEDRYTLEQLYRAVREVGDGAQGEDEAVDDDPTTGALIWRLGAALGASEFSMISKTSNWMNCSNLECVRSFS